MSTQQPLGLHGEPPIAPMRKRARSVPVCAACGRRLSKYTGNSQSNRELSASNIRKSGVEPSKVLPDFTADGMPPTRGAYGDNLLCSQVCGHLLAVRLIVALGVDVLHLLPAAWRHR